MPGERKYYPPGELAAGKGDEQLENPLRGQERREELVSHAPLDHVVMNGRPAANHLSTRRSW